MTFNIFASQFIREIEASVIKVGTLNFMKCFSTFGSTHLYQQQQQQQKQLQEDQEDEQDNVTDIFATGASVQSTHT